MSIGMSIRTNTEQPASTMLFVSTPWMMMAHFLKEPTRTSIVWSRIYLGRLGWALSFRIESRPDLMVQLQKEYEDEFLKSKFTLSEYIRRLQRWRDRYERNLDSRPRLQPLDLLSHYLTEFQHGKFDDIEIPGQYTEASSIPWRYHL